MNTLIVNRDSSNAMNGRSLPPSPVPLPPSALRLPPSPFRLPPSRRSGFTLIEILTVTVIIGMLVALVAGTAPMVRNLVRNWRMKAEIMQLSLAIERVRTELGGGEYPPDGTNQADMVRFLRRAFPRAAFYDPANPPNNIPAGAAPYPPRMCPDQALVFWLGGMQDSNNNFIGFSADPTNPFDTANPSRVGPFFEFDKSRLKRVALTTANLPNYSTDQLQWIQQSLVNNQYVPQYWLTPSGNHWGTGSGQFWAYFPQNDLNITDAAPGGSAVPMPYSPYLYFKAVSSLYCQFSGTTYYHNGWWQAPNNKVLGPNGQANQASFITPFKDSHSYLPTPPVNGYRYAWQNPKLFQILCPGLDGWYAPTLTGVAPPDPTGAAVIETADANSRFAPLYPDGTNYRPQTMDDITNFSNGKVSSDMP
jgi:prepilin-type N-terminal cleavage/methylation domain-containing protein